MTSAACTIVSLNYLGYARTLCESFLAQHPDLKFYVLIVDRVPPGMDLTHENFEAILIEDLNIPRFNQLAFKYDILELNTNVKPSFLKFLLNQNIDRLIYFDPDIYIYNSVEFIYSILEQDAVVLTPHSISPAPKEDQGLEQAFLSLGVFNLGFIGVSKHPQALKFLDWWEERCWNLAYCEAKTGLFVDQKWANLAPCFFDRIHILKHVGCNVAYWNLFERHISVNSTNYLVNAKTALIFFHFSGVSAEKSERVSSKARANLTFESRPDLKDLFDTYKVRLKANQRPDENSQTYAFGEFSDGTPISTLARRVYAAGDNSGIANENPFSNDASFYRIAKRRRLIGSRDTSSKYDSRNINESDLRIRILNLIFRIMLRILGNDRYTMLLKYIGHASILRNQPYVLNINLQNQRPTQPKDL